MERQVCIRQTPLSTLESNQAAVIGWREYLFGFKHKRLFWTPRDLKVSMSLDDLRNLSFPKFQANSFFLVCRFVGLNLVVKSCVQFLCPGKRCIWIRSYRCNYANDAALPSTTKFGRSWPPMLYRAFFTETCAGPGTWDDTWARTPCSVRMTRMTMVPSGAKCKCTVWENRFWCASGPKRMLN